jgi:bifunctional N-acetylglucosamine-1-phosphate-uridyltransferase/glucosamine-1-phosphate-acetyltransferase GlmU-like protein
MLNISVIIMAGGKGKRMGSELPKVLQLVGEIPMLVHIIKTVRKLDINKLMVVIGKYKDIIIKTILEYTHIDDITFVMQHNTLGTGHAVMCCVPELKQLNSNDKILILNGDSPLMQSNILNRFVQSTTIASLIITDTDDPTGYGRIKKTKNGFNIIEQTDCDEETAKITKVNTGYYCVRNDIAQQYLPKLQNNNAQKEYYIPHLLTEINNDIPINIYHIDKNISWMIASANTQDQLKKLNTLYDINIVKSI